MKRVLLVAYGGGHVTMVMPVMRELERRGVACTLMALTTGYRKAQRMGFQPLGYRDFTHVLDDLDTVMAAGERLAPDNQHPEVDALETRLYLGVNYLEWVREYGEEGARSRYDTLGRRGFLPRDFMLRVLRDLRPDVVVTTNSPRTEQASIEAAVELGIPVLSMIDLFALSYDPYLQRTIHADRIAVINDFVKDNVVAAGVDPARVVVTGNPAFDSLADPQSLEQARELRRRLGWEDKKVVLLAGQLEELPGTPEHWRGPKLVTEVEAQLRGFVAERIDRALIVRHHPNEFQAYPDLGTHPRVYKSQPVNEPVHPALLAADSVVVQTSTVGLEAVLSGRRLLTLAYSPAVTPEGWDYSHMGLAVPIPTIEDVVPLVEQSLVAPPSDLRPFNVGQAAQSVVAQVLSMMGNT